MTALEDLPTIGYAERPGLVRERLGDRTLVYARLSDGQDITAEGAGNSQVRLGDRICLRIDGGSAHLFDADGNGHHAADARA